MTACVVYWIHKERHSDMTKEGYIGITTNFKVRMWNHPAKTKVTNNILQRAIRKYGWDNLFKTIVFEGDKEFCKSKEAELRPAEFIGWNTCIGGCLPRSPSLEARLATSLRCKGKPGTPHTEDFKRKLRLRNMKYIYTITHPNGFVETVSCLKDWCELNGLRQNCMNRVSSGKRKQHKGYYCTRVTI